MIGEIRKVTVIFQSRIYNNFKSYSYSNADASLYRMLRINSQLSSCGEWNEVQTKFAFCLNVSILVLLHFSIFQFYYTAYPCIWLRCQAKTDSLLQTQSARSFPQGITIHGLSPELKCGKGPPTIYFLLQYNEVCIPVIDVVRRRRSANFSLFHCQRNEISGKVKFTLFLSESEGRREE